MSQVTLQGNASGTGIFTLAAPNSNTNRTLNLPDAEGDVVLTTATQTLTNKSISGAQINSGTVAVARLGSGTPGTGNFLRGDGSWQTVPASAPSTTDVLNATAGASLDAVGSYRIAVYNSTTALSPNGTTAGSNLFQRNTNSSAFATGLNDQDSSTFLTGTWRFLGQTRIARSSGVSDATRPAGLFLRIS
jgi:hypothetical protein